ncbi:MAG: molecular chaperone [Burkholderiaceae bacterium]
MKHAVQTAPRQPGERALPRGSEIWIRQFDGQMLVCGLLAKALYGAPDRGWLDQLIVNSVFDAIPFGEALPEMAEAAARLKAWADSHRAGLDDAAFEVLSDDYTRLFVGPGRLGAAPWESVYVNKDRAVFQLETAAVSRWYERFGVAIASDYNEPADHVGLEFSFMAHLANLTVQASMDEDGEEVGRLIAAQRGFVGQHLARWVPAWADEVERNAKTGCYVALAALARAAVAELQSFFAVSLPRVPASGPFRIVPA